MFGVKLLVVKTVLCWSVINVVLVESVRHKKDVHHMIILNEEVRPPRSHRYKIPWHSAGRPKRRPGKKNQHLHPSSSYEESFEGISREEDAKVQKSKSKSHEPSHKRHKAYKSHKRHRAYKSNKGEKQSHHSGRSPSSPDSKWKPVTSEELFGPYQKVPMEITTPFSLPPNTFFSFESTLYPPLSSGFDMAAQSSIVRPVQPYKPFDYSLLERTTKKPERAVSIVLDDSAEEEEKDTKIEEVPTKREKNKKRGRGTSRFRIRTSSKNKSD